MAGVKSRCFRLPEMCPATSSTQAQRGPQGSVGIAEVKEKHLVARTGAVKFCLQHGQGKSPLERAELLILLVRALRGRRDEYLQQRGGRMSQGLLVPSPAPGCATPLTAGILGRCRLCRSSWRAGSSCR